MTVYAHLSPAGITIYSRGESKAYPLNAQLPVFEKTNLVIVVNSRRTIIRIADVKRSPWPATRRRLVRDAFPIGEIVNRDTYVFDGAMFTSEGGKRFLMAALPMEISDAAARVGFQLVKNFNRLKRLDTVEHFLFRKYASQDTLILLPQEEGLRILQIKGGLPHGAFYISNSIKYREAELARLGLSLTSAIFLYTRQEEAAPWQWLRTTISIDEMPLSLV